MPRSAAIALLLVALLVAGCGVTRVVSGRAWSTTATRTDGSAYTVDITDASGLAANAEVDPAGVAWAEGVANAPGRADVLLVSWVGGGCDARTEISIATAGAGLAIGVQTTSSGAVCDDVGVPHVLRLTLSGPMPAAGVSVTRRG
ncbi:MAG: hypothetical protein WCK58_10395 [Chloroflexota bacterium]